MRPLIRVTTTEDGVTTVRTNEHDPAPVTRAQLLDCTREELATRIIELTAELDRERARSAQARRDSETATHMARTMNTGVPSVGSFG